MVESVKSAVADEDPEIYNYNARRQPCNSMVKHVLYEDTPARVVSEFKYDDLSDNMNHVDKEIICRVE